MSYIIADDYNYFFESLYALCLLVNDGNNDKDKDSEQNMTDNKIAERYAPINEIYEHLSANLNPENEFLQLLFKINNELSDDICSYLWTVLTYCVKEDGSIHIDKYAAFVDFFNDTVEINDDAEFYNYILTKDISVSLKSKLIYVYMSFDEMFGFLMDTLKKTEALLREKIFLVEELTRESVLDMKQGFEELGMEGFFNDLQIPVTFLPDHDFIIYPTISDSNSVHIFHQGQYKNLIVHWGINLSWRKRYKDSAAFSKDNLLDAFKAITEKTKFEILLLLSHERLYGSQIAKRIGITTATVSHHLSQMAALNLITIGKEQNRIYYQLNKEVVTALIEGLKERLI